MRTRPCATNSQRLLAPNGVFITNDKHDMGSDPITRNISETLERIAELNPSLNAFITVLEAEAMAQARQLDEELREGRSRGPLHGLPISIKDLIDVKGVPTTAASRVRHGHIAQADATVVSRLRDAGAVIIGKCNLHEFALGTTNDESAFGPARNPRDTTRSPADRAAVPRLPLRQDWDGRRSAPIRGDRFGFRPPRAESSDSNPHSERFRPRAWFLSPFRSITWGRLPQAFGTRGFCSAS